MATNTSSYTKAKEIENKIHKITGFITTTECNRFKKTIFNAKINMHRKALQVKLQRILLLIGQVKIERKY